MAQQPLPSDGSAQDLYLPSVVAASNATNLVGGGADGPPQKKRKRNRKRAKQKANAGASQAQPGQNSNQQAGGSQASQEKVISTAEPKKQPKPRQPPLQPDDPLYQTIQRAKFTVKGMTTSTAELSCVFPKFNSLPLESQRRIFEEAYRLNDPYKPPAHWPCISHQVKEWIEAIIYESIILPYDFDDYHPYKRLELFERTFHSRPKEFFARNVKRIFTNNDSKSHDSDFELKLLRACDNLTSLECWSNPKEELTTILRTKEWPTLKTLCLDIDLLPKDESTFHLPLFQHITHLDLTSQEPQLPSWKSLKSLANLLHLRIYTLAKFQSKEVERTMDQVYAIASEVQKYLPLNLETFVILVPMDIIYHIVSLGPKTVDHHKWTRFDSIRIGTFDPRIMLGSCCDWDSWADDAMSEVDDEEEQKMFKYLQIVPHLKRPDGARDLVGPYGDEEKDTWKEVFMKDRKRKASLAS